MKKTKSHIFNQLFVALYVVMGYTKYYCRHITWKSAATASFGGVLIISLLIYFGTPPKNGNAALNDGYEFQNQGKIKQAHASFQQAYEIFNEQRYGRGMFVSLNAMGDIDLTNNNYTEALTHFDGALRLAKQYGDQKSQIRLFKKHAEVKLKMGRINAARAHYYDAIKIAQDEKLNRDIGSLFTHVGNLERDIGNDQKARFSYRNAMKSLETANYVEEEAHLHLNMGTLDGGLDNYQAAISSYSIARKLFKQRGSVFNEATTVTHMARLEKKLGSPEKAVNYYNEAATLLASIRSSKALQSLKNEAGLL